MSRVGRIGPFTCAIPFPPLFTCTPYIVASNVVNHSVSLLGGYTSLCATFSLGRMDCLGIDHSYHGKRGRDVRDAKDSS